MQADEYLLSFTDSQQSKISVLLTLEMDLGFSALGMTPARFNCCTMSVMKTYVTLRVCASMPL